jgi:hypothetical protein
MHCRRVILAIRQLSHRNDQDVMRPEALKACQPGMGSGIVQMPPNVVADHIIPRVVVCARSKNRLLASFRDAMRSIRPAAQRNSVLVMISFRSEGNASGAPEFSSRLMA